MFRNSNIRKIFIMFEVRFIIFNQNFNYFEESDWISVRPQEIFYPGLDILPRFVDCFYTTEHIEIIEIASARNEYCLLYLLSSIFHDVRKNIFIEEDLHSRFPHLALPRLAKVCTSILRLCGQDRQVTVSTVR